MGHDIKYINVITLVGLSTATAVVVLKVWLHFSTCSDFEEKKRHELKSRKLEMYKKTGNFFEDQPYRSWSYILKHPYTYLKEKKEIHRRNNEMQNYLRSESVKIKKEFFLDHMISGSNFKLP